MEGLCITAIRGTPGASYCWCCRFCVLLQLEVELDIDNFCGWNVYPTVIAWLVSVCNKNLLSFYRGILTLGIYSCRCIPSETMAMYHFKKTLWITALGQGTLTTCPYISMFSKPDATYALTLSPWYIQNRAFSEIKLFLSYSKRFCVPVILQCSTYIVLVEASV